MSSTPIPRPYRERAPATESRDSVLRASILESALELGVATNRTVANWIFNPVEDLKIEELISIRKSATVWCHEDTGDVKVFN